MLILHENVTTRIIGLLPLRDKIACLAVSKEFRRLCKGCLAHIENVSLDVGTSGSSGSKVTEKLSCVSVDPSRIMYALSCLNTICVGMTTLCLTLDKPTEMDIDFLDSLPENLQSLIAPLASIHEPEHPMSKLKHINVARLAFDIFNISLFPVLESLEVGRIETPICCPMPYGFKRLTTNSIHGHFINYFGGLDFLGELARSPGAETIEYLGPVRSRHFLDGVSHAFPKCKSLKIKRGFWDAVNFIKILLENPQLEEVFISAWTKDGQEGLNEMQEVIVSLPRHVKSFGIGIELIDTAVVQMIGQLKPNLEALHLYSHPDQDKPFDNFLPLFRSSDFLPNLQKLQVIVGKCGPDFLREDLIPIIQIRMLDGKLKSLELLSKKSPLTFSDEIRRRLLSPRLKITAKDFRFNLEGPDNLRFSYCRTVDIHDTGSDPISGLLITLNPR